MDCSCTNNHHQRSHTAFAVLNCGILVRCQLFLEPGTTQGTGPALPQVAASPSSSGFTTAGNKNTPYHEIQNLKHPPTKLNETERRAGEYFERGKLRDSPEHCVQPRPRQAAYKRSAFLSCLSFSVLLPCSQETQHHPIVAPCTCLSLAWPLQLDPDQQTFN